MNLELIREALAEAEGVEAERLRIFPKSWTEQDGIRYLLYRAGLARRLLILRSAARHVPLPPGFRADGALGASIEGEAHEGALCEASGHNAAALRRVFPWTAPCVLGLRTSIGMGDRLGLATPGHIRACAKTGALPVLAQQSIREMQRTGRTPRDVMDDATWGAFQEGWRGGFGADADHLKNEADIESTFEAGFTMFTLDPSEFVANDAARLAGAELEARYKALPFAELSATAEDLLERYAGREFPIDSPGGPALSLRMDRESFLRTAVKYGRAVAHTVKLARHLKKLFGERLFDLEMSVDETEFPTTAPEHLFVALELKRLGVSVQSLAPRFVGEFQKAIDFIGDLRAFEASFRLHAAIARFAGPYKLSIHSGSDKFAVFPIMGRIAGGLLHEKTAGTSYLEALRVIARRDPGLFREILKYALERYPKDRATYHVQAEVSNVDPPDFIPDGRLENLLACTDGRQILHVTYGSVLTAVDDRKLRFKPRFMELLTDHEEEYAEVIESHFVKHIKALGMDRVGVRA